MLLTEMFIKEQGQDAAIIFGRFNPPHLGHVAAWKEASKSPIWYVGTNKSTQGPKDPLPYDIKIKVMEALYPEIKGHLVAETTWFTLAAMVYAKHGAVTLHIVTDEQDSATYVAMLKKQNGVDGPHGFYNFKNIVWQPAPRLSSATDLRDAVAANDPKAFAKAAGVSADTKIDGEPFFNLVKFYLDAQAKPVKKVAEGYAGIDDTDTVGFYLDSEAAYTAVMAKFGDHIDYDETSGIMYVPASMWPNVEAVAFDADGVGATKDYDFEHPDSPEQDMAEGSLEEIDRRGFLKGLGAAAATAAVPAIAQAGSNKSWTGRAKVGGTLEKNVVYYITYLKRQPDGILIAGTTRVGPSGNSTAVRAIDCNNAKWKYLEDDGNKVTGMKWSEFVGGSSAFQIAMWACGGAEKVLKEQGVAEGTQSTTWVVHYDYGPHQSNEVKVKASSEDDARAKAVRWAKNHGHSSIMINRASPAEQGVAEEQLDELTGMNQGPVKRDIPQRKKPTFAELAKQSTDKRSALQRQKDGGKKNWFAEDNVAEGVGVVANNAKQAKDPRYVMSMTADVKPGETQRQAKKMGFKLDKKGMPPLMHSTAAKNTSPNKAYNLGLTESKSFKRKK
jgi:hypothetical protein